MGAANCKIAAERRAENPGRRPARAGVPGGGIPPSIRSAMARFSACSSRCQTNVATGLPGATSFFTVNLLDRRSSLLVAHIDARRTVRGRSPFHIDARVVLADHMHSLWTLPLDLLSRDTRSRRRR